MRNLGAIIIAAAGLLVAGVGCSKTNEPSQLGTNTNWLQACSASDDCSGAAECLCGVCTRACSSQAQCAVAGAEARCMPLATASCGAAATGSACLAAGGGQDRDSAVPDATAGFPDDGNTLPPSCDASFVFAPMAGTGGVSGAGGTGGAGSEPPPPPPCGCTRRPGDGNSFQCPMGTGQSVVMEVGPEGGTVQLTGTASTQGVAVELRIPPTALDRTVAIRITETSIPPWDELSDFSPVYHFEPEALRFATPVELRMPWSSSLQAVPSDLAIYFSDEPGSCAFAPLDDNYRNAGFNQGSVLGLGWAIVGVPRADACP